MKKGRTEKRDRERKGKRERKREETEGRKKARKGAFILQKKN